MSNPTITFQVASATHAKLLATAMQSHFPPMRPELLPKLRLECIGAGCVNVATKALAIARGQTTEHGYDLVSLPHFEHVKTPGGVITMIVIEVEHRP